MSKYDPVPNLVEEDKTADLDEVPASHMGDGEWDLLEIAETIGIYGLELEEPLTTLMKCGLLIPKESFR